MEPPAAASGADYETLGLDEHIRKKSMWAGSLKKTKSTDLWGLAPAPEGPRLERIAGDHTPALLKIIDEGLVNASDHFKEHERAKGRGRRVTRIALTYDAETGRVAIENDGPGIPIELNAKASADLGRDVYVPEVAFTIPLSGRNMRKAPDSVKGGVNGLGAKLMNMHSAEFTLRTVSGGKVYLQAFRDRMRTIAPPEIFGARTKRAKALGLAGAAPQTRVEFLPAYAELDYGPGGPTPRERGEIEAWCRWRMHLLAAYVGGAVEVLFNGEPCRTPTAESLAALAGAGPIVALAAKAKAPPYRAHPWSVAVGLAPPGGKAPRLISVINGVRTARGGHAAHVKELIRARVAGAFKKLKKAPPTQGAVFQQVVLVIVGALPGAEWGGQRKNELQASAGALAHYALPPADLRRAAELVTGHLLRGAEKAVRRKKRRVEADKYTRARRAGTKDAGACRLLLGEGDSAIALLRAILSKGKATGGPSFARYGIFSLGGVIMNARKQVTPVPARGGGTTLVRSSQLRKNKVLAALVEILGLDFTCRYATAAERARLRYGGVIICTDQDLDGTGKILCLVLVWFHLFWPNLVAAGYVQRLMTPVIRAYPKGGGSPLEFAYEVDFARWAAARGGEEAVTRAHAVKYYKGLGSHDTAEVDEMARAFARSVYSFALDGASDRLFEVYFGADPAGRKRALASPVAYLSDAEAAAIHRSRRIPCSVQLRVDAKACKLDYIQRQIPGVADGIPIARRKVLRGAMARFRQRNREIKVFQLGGYIAEHMFYHHGDASLNATIIGMAQGFPGALNFPCLVGLGQFGTRHRKGKDAASPRYINVRLASPYVLAMYPEADTWLLPHVFEDGERAQPRHFVPVLPASCLESFEIPSEGWRHKSYARDFAQVVALVRAYADPAAPGHALVAACVAAGAPTPELRARFPLGPSLRGYGEALAPADRATLVREIPEGGGLVPYSFGWYLPEPGKGGRTTIRVTELPIGLSTEAFLRDLRAPKRAELIEEVVDESSGARVDIAVVLAPGAYEAIVAPGGGYLGRRPDTDPIEEFLLLRRSLRPHLNYCGTDGAVLEFGADYHALLLHWAPLRRDLYRRRLERKAALLRLRARLEREVVRFIESGLRLAELPSEAAAVEALRGRGFPPLDAALLAAPRYATAAEIERRATEGGGVGFAYLLDLRARDLVRAAKEKRAAKAARLEARLAETEAVLAEEPFPGASVWRREIDAVVAAVRRGERTGWRFTGA